MFRRKTTFEVVFPDSEAAEGKVALVKVEGWLPYTDNHESEGRYGQTLLPVAPRIGETVLHFPMILTGTVDLDARAWQQLDPRNLSILETPGDVQ